ncbi:MAG: DUF4367 domain-containing protein [Oscillospiraceae bacterium]|nr:DUF4367 domain-containing protein [Oscillospiraceae bacterium]
MAASKNNDMYSYLDQLSTQELESLLQKDAEAPDGGDLDMVMYIMEVIEKREGGADKTAAADALKDFFSAYATPEGDGRCLYPGNDADDKEAKSDPAKVFHKSRHRKFSLRGAGLIAAVLVCVFSLAACSVGGIGRFFQMVGKWTSEVFAFENTYDGDIPKVDGSELAAPLENAQYASMEEALAAYGIAEKVVPTSFPEGFEIVAVEVNRFENPDFVKFCAMYQGGDHYLILQVRQILDLNMESFEKDSDAVTEYVKDGLRHYFYTNMDSNCVTWFNGNLECFIDTNLPEEDLTLAIDSIYER